MSDSKATELARDSRAYLALKEMILGERPLIYICSHEEARVERLLRDAAQREFDPPLPFWTWSATRGLQREDAPVEPERIGPGEVLSEIISHTGPALFLLRDFHEFLVRDPDVRRLLRDVYATCGGKSKFAVISSPVRVLPEEVSRQIGYIELALPELAELLHFVSTESARFQQRGIAVDRSDATAFAVARAVQGLTLDEARHALARAVAIEKKLDAGSLPLLLEEKKQIVNRSGLIQFVADGTRIEDVGGLEYLKKWLLERRKLFVERDSLTAEIVPKGVLVMGVSGCGKSLSVKAVASCFGLPLYRIDMIEVFSGRHGNPDAAFVSACRLSESLSPAVIWFDEIEMGLTGQTGDTATNLGRIFAFFLTWMQEKTRGLFVAATANRIDLLPAEMIRKGRFDEVFFIDLPTEDERMEILKIHLERRGIDPAGLQLPRLKRITQAWTGAEIEQCVVSALTSVRLSGREMAFEDLHAAALNVIPLSKTMREQVEHIRSWAYDRAVRASPKEGVRV